ncbi:MAG TPA: amidase family protein, partial [bacterium]|nr:amidase family protein [bacterium]
MSDDAALWFGSIAELGARYRAGELSPVAVTGAFLERVRRLDGRLHAFITVADAQAMVDAGTAESRLRRGDPSPLLGIPLAVKD